MRSAQRDLLKAKSMEKEKSAPTLAAGKIKTTQVLKELKSSPSRPDFFHLN
jgi:hypothetical protein